MSSRDLQSQIDSLCQRIRVLEIEAGLVAAPEAEEATSSSVGGYSATATGSPVPLVEEDGVLGWDRRLQIARDTGNIFRRCLEGRDRRRSAQPKVGLPKRVYVVVRDRDKAGKVYRDPVRVFFPVQRRRPFGPGSRRLRRFDLCWLRLAARGEGGCT